MKKFIASIIFFSIIAAIIPTATFAASKEDFNPGNIIDDYTFYNADSMDAGQIQSFITSKQPNCDYDGIKPASDWGYPNLTHAQFAEKLRTRQIVIKDVNGDDFHAPPYRCLSKYSQQTPQQEAASGLCEGIPAYASRTAAQIIKDVATACHINPQVLIVLLEKEQSLVTDTWPVNRQLNKATGFACSDSAPCDPAYEGFYSQVYNAARQFKIYQAFPSRYNYLAGRSQGIQWNPNKACGSSQVFIENQATAGLYVYTPYQPNKAALDNLYGTGDGCSAYGNRNFWRIFTDWFGTTRSQDNRKPLVSKATDSLTIGSQLKAGEFLTSPNGKFILMMHPSGQLIVYKSKQIVWQSGPVNWSQKDAHAQFQEDGNIVIYKDKEPLWATNTANTPATRLALQNDGNLVLYNTNSTAMWASDTSQSFPILNLKGASLISGQKLSVDDYLRSSDWRYFLLMQSDGNLVLYTAGYMQPIWASNTSGKGGKYVSMQTDGNLVMYGDKGAVWASGTDGASQSATLDLQVDGNLVLYNTVNTPRWASGTDGKGGKYVSMQTDGNLVMYGDKGAVWASGTDGASQSATVFTCTNTGKATINTRLNQKDSLCSNDRKFMLSFQTDGNLVLYGRKTSAKWASGAINRFFRSDLNL